MHNHNTVETFMGIKGRWRVDWEGAEGTDTVELDQLDFFAIPPGFHRRFECIAAPEGESTGLLLGIIEGTAPAADFSPEAVKRMEQAGLV